MLSKKLGLRTIPQSARKEVGLRKENIMLSIIIDIAGAFVDIGKSAFDKSPIITIVLLACAFVPFFIKKRHHQ